MEVLPRFNQVVNHCSENMFFCRLATNNYLWFNCLLVQQLVGYISASLILGIIILLFGDKSSIKFQTETKTNKQWLNHCFEFSLFLCQQPVSSQSYSFLDHCMSSTTSGMKAIQETSQLLFYLQKKLFKAQLFGLLRHKLETR